MQAVRTEVIRQIGKKLNEGAVIAYPTEGVWGLGCNPAYESAVQRILDLKTRPVDKGLILLADSVERLTPYLKEPLNEQVLQTGSERPVTWIVNHGGQTPDWISGGRDSVAIRVTRHPIVCELCDAADMPLVSTSANPSGAEPALSREQVAEYFKTGIDIIVPGELGGETGASEIREYSTGKILREAG